MNNLADPAIVEELYKASQAGAEIDLIVRAVCVLRPGVEGLSERIRVRSILGRFLEHSRLYCFEAGDAKTYLLGSADLMPRNLDHRIEMVVPVEAPHVRAEIETIFRAAPDRQLAGLDAGRRRALGAQCSPRTSERRRAGPARRDARPRPRAAGRGTGSDG